MAKFGLLSAVDDCARATEGVQNVPVRRVGGLARWWRGGREAAEGAAGKRKAPPEALWLPGAPPSSMTHLLGPEPLLNTRRDDLIEGVITVAFVDPLHETAAHQRI